MKDAALEMAAGQLGKEPFDGIEPRGRSRDEMERPARVAAEPSANVGVFVAAIIVEDHVDQPAGLPGMSCSAFVLDRLPYPFCSVQRLERGHAWRER